MVMPDVNSIINKLRGEYILYMHKCLIMVNATFFRVKLYKILSISFSHGQFFWVKYILLPYL